MLWGSGMRPTVVVLGGKVPLARDGGAGRRALLGSPRRFARGRAEKVHTALVAPGANPGSFGCVPDDRLERIGGTHHAFACCMPRVWTTSLKTRPRWL